MLKYSLTALFLVASFQVSEAQTAEENKIKDCLVVRGRDAKIKCLIEVSKVLDEKLAAITAKVDKLVEQEKNTVKLDGSYHLLGIFRGQCMQWVDTGRPANFVGCNNEPDQNFRFQ